MEDLKEYKNKIKEYLNLTWFKELAGIVNLYNPEGTHEEILINIDNYIKLYLAYLDLINIMDKNITIRYQSLLGEEKLKKLIDKLNLQLAKQEFIKLLIGPMDSNLGNTALMISNGDNIKNLNIDIAPAYDLDLSFNISKELVKNNFMNFKSTSNGETATMQSLIQDFSNIPGFNEFLLTVVKKTKNPNLPHMLVDNAHKKTGLDFFKSHSTLYIEFLEDRFTELQKAFNVFYEKQKGEEI